ncbi:putative iron-regulated membrane protein [Anopheles sinensis]|uniref:Putative iron-regulated membrane protein n=1 Tax=Anopheles sinensis TaxID=74873 RepID=A0A084W1V2_ANOSI|nr:putative iron-regulated membrane protein [Anopheles sinensis]
MAELVPTTRVKMPERSSSPAPEREQKVRMSSDGTIRAWSHVWLGLGSGVISRWRGPEGSPVIRPIRGARERLSPSSIAWVDARQRNACTPFEPPQTPGTRRD